MLHEHSELVELPVVTLDLLESKMHVPLVRPGSVSRTPLVNRLRASELRQVVTVARTRRLREDDGARTVGRT